MDLVEKAYNYAREKHQGQMYGDMPYTYHLNCVGTLVFERNEENPLLSTLMAIAYLHDVMEDCGVTYEELVKEFGVCIAYAVRALTKTPLPEGKDAEEHYMEYMQGCVKVALALEVKKCDTMTNLFHSFKNSRQKGINKYVRQIRILENGGFV